MKVNHHSLNYKMEKQPNKKYKELKQKQKAKIAQWMYEMTCDYYQEYQQMPDETASEELMKKLYGKIQSLAIWVPLEEVSHQYQLKLPRYEIRISENGIPEKKKEKPEKDDSKKKRKGSSNKLCPTCGKRMKQQFIGLQHCRCGTSWMKEVGYFERTEDMVFALERRNTGGKVKQHPVIRYR